MKTLPLYIIVYLALSCPGKLAAQNPAQQPAGSTIELLEQCEQAIKNNNHEQALSYAIQAKNCLAPTSKVSLKGETSHWLANCYFATGKLDEAITEFHVAIDFLKSSKDTLGLAKCYNDLGRLYKKEGNYAEAINAFNEALRYFVIADDLSGIAQVNLNIGTILKNIGLNERAKIEYRKALAIFIRIGDTYNEAGCYNNLGNIFKNQQRYDSAFHYMYKTLAIRERDSAQTVRAYIYHNLANLHLATHNTDSAMLYSQKSLKINTALASKLDMAYDYNTLGSIYIELKNWNEAIRCHEMALQYGAQYAMTDNRLDILKQLGHSYYQAGNYKLSAEKYLAYTELNDSIQRLKESGLIENELLGYQLFADSIKTRQLLLEQDLEASKMAHNALADRINTRNFYYVFVILFLVIAMIAILFFSARRRLNQTRSHQAVLQIQNDELKRTLISKEEKEILLKEVHHRVKNNLQIINSLIRLQSNFMNAANFKEKLVETENRIRSMALIHEKLYKTGNLASLGIQNYIEELSFNIIESYENHNVNIKIKFDLEEREYGIDALIPIGLIINETLSNSLKYAFYDRSEGHVWISIHSDDKKSVMIIKDDGTGADLSMNELKEDSLGIELILSLADQLDGTVTLQTEKGFEYRFDFPRLG